MIGIRKCLLTLACIALVFTLLYVSSFSLNNNKVYGQEVAGFFTGTYKIFRQFGHISGGADATVKISGPLTEVTPGQYDVTGTWRMDLDSKIYESDNINLHEHRYQGPASEFDNLHRVYSNTGGITDNLNSISGRICFEDAERDGIQGCIVGPFEPVKRNPDGSITSSGTRKLSSEVTQTWNIALEGPVPPPAPRSCADIFNDQIQVRNQLANLEGRIVTTQAEIKKIQFDINYNQGLINRYEDAIERFKRLGFPDTHPSIVGFQNDIEKFKAAIALLKQELEGPQATLESLNSQRDSLRERQNELEAEYQARKCAGPLMR